MLMRTHPGMCFSMCQAGNTCLDLLFAFFIFPRLFARFRVYFLSKLMNLMSLTLKICTAQDDRTRKMTGFARIIFNLCHCNKFLQIYITMLSGNKT